MTKRDTEKRLTKRQQVGLAALLECGDVTAASKKSGVSRNTLHKWLRQDTFARELQNRQDAALAGVMRRLLAKSMKAIDVLCSEMTNKKGTPQSRIRASTAILEYAARYIDSTDLAERLVAIEEACDL